MAHPFRYFRKHQKAFLAVAAVIAMFVFVIGDAIFGYIGQGGGPDPNKVVASWKGGRVTALELETLTQRRYFVSQFLRNLFSLGGSRLIEEGGNPMQPSVPPDFILGENAQPDMVSYDAVATRILADQARKAGISISDQVINHYLREISFRRVSDAEIAALLQQMRGGDARGLEEQLFAGLRELLLRDVYVQGYTRAVQNILPEQRWEDWRRTNERISLEAVEVATSDFIQEIPDPKDTELLAFYEEHKDDIGHQTYSVLGKELRSANPGFKEPRRVKISYLLGDVTTWAEKYKDSVTDDEIADYYERNKRTQFVKSGDSPVFDESLFDSQNNSEEPAADPASPGAEATENAPPADDNATPEQPVQPQESNGEQPPSEPAAATSESEESPPPTDGAESPQGDQSGRVSHRGQFHLTAFQNNEENVADEVAEDAADTAESVAAEVDEAAREAEATESGAPDIDVTEADTEQSEIANEPVAPGDAAGESATPTGDVAPRTETAPGAASAETEAADQDAPLEYVPLDEVRDEIRMNLARDKAVVELRKVMDKALGEMQSAYTEYNLAKFSQQSKDTDSAATAVPATLTNFTQRAKETGLVSEETVLLTQRELADTAVGKSRDVQTQTRPVAYAAFTDLATYQPMLTEDIDGNLYLVAKVEDVPENVPAFKDIKTEVLRAWKEREAAQLALKKAEELAAAAEKAGDTLATYFIGKPYEVITTDMFTYLTFGTTSAELQRGARLGEAPPLEDVGPDFMEKAFELKDAEVAALLNYDHSKAYVFRLDRRETPLDELKSLFLREANNWYGGRIMMASRLDYQKRQVLAEVLERVDFDREQLEEFLQPNEQEGEE